MRILASKLNCSSLKFLALTAFIGLSGASIDSHASGAKMVKSLRNGFKKDSKQGHGGGVHGAEGFADDGTSPYKTRPAPSSATANLNIKAFQKRLKNMKSKSGKYYAAGVRESLNALMPKNMGGGPNAKEWNTGTLNRWAPPCYSQTHDSNPEYQNFDVKVLPPTANGGSVHGHVEMFYNGVWYSDFRQTRSGSANIKRYKPGRVYRMQASCNKSASSQIDKDVWTSLWDLVMNSAVAKSNKTSEDMIPSPKKILLKLVIKLGNTDWELVEFSKNQGYGYELHRIQKGARLLVGQDGLSAFSLLDQFSSNKSIPSREIAKAFFADWVKSAGKKEVQEAILGAREMTMLQKDTYVDAGFKLPAEYIISVSGSK